MYKEKHILNKTYGNHQLSRYLDVYETTLQTDGQGTVSASKLTGYAGDNITLSNTPNSGYEFSAYTLTGANLTGNTFKLTDSDVTAKAWFYQPVAKLADTSPYELWVPKRSYSLHPTVENIGVSINSDAYRYVVYSIQYIFYDNGFVLLRPDAQTSWPSIVNHWNIARYNDKIYIAQLSGTNSNYIANIDTWTNGNATVTSYVDGIDGMVAGNYIECTNSQYTNFAKLILDKQESRVSAYVAESDYSNWYTYQGCATVNTTSDSTRLEAQCTSNENSRVNTHLKVYGCTAFSDATGCYYNK